VLATALAYMAPVVSPTSAVFAPQELRHKRVALDYGNGTAYACLRLRVHRGVVPDGRAPWNG